MWQDQNVYDESGTGGFFTEPNAIDSPAPKKAGESQRHQSAVPLFIRQITSHSAEDFTLFGMPVQIVVIVGILREYEVQSTKATYTVEDHTGRITGYWWLENDSDQTRNLPVVKEGSYVRIFGFIRNQEGQKLLMIVKMMAVDDINEVTTHLLECVHVRFEAEALTNSSIVGPNNPGLQLTNSMNFDGDGDSVIKLNPMQEKIIAMLRPLTHTHSGTSREAVLGGFPPNLHREVNEALEFLVCEGQIYNTINCNHFRITDL